MTKIKFTESSVLHKYDRVVMICRNQIKNVFRNCLKEESDIPKFAIVLGTSGPKGLLALAEIKQSVSYLDIGVPAPGVPGHTGNLHYALIGNIPVFICEGRAHYFEGHSMDNITLLVRALATLEIENFILTNASGSLNTHIQPGVFGIVTDHINNMCDSPLRGTRDFFHGQFLSQENNYDRRLVKLAHNKAKNLGIRLSNEHGNACVYTAIAGPEFETPAEITKFAGQCAHLIGMSTIPEVLALRQLGRNVLAISLVTNMGAGFSEKIVSHDDNLDVVKSKDDDFSKLIFNIVSSHK